MHFNNISEHLARKDRDDRFYHEFQGKSVISPGNNLFSREQNMSLSEACPVVMKDKSFKTHLFTVKEGYKKTFQIFTFNNLMQIIVFCISFFDCPINSLTIVCMHVQM